MCVFCFLAIGGGPQLFLKDYQSVPPMPGDFYLTAHKFRQHTVLSETLSVLVLDGFLSKIKTSKGQRTHFCVVFLL